MKSILATAILIIAATGASASVVKYTVSLTDRNCPGCFQGPASGSLSGIDADHDGVLRLDEVFKLSFVLPPQVGSNLVPTLTEADITDLALPVFATDTKNAITVAADIAICDFGGTPFRDCFPGDGNYTLVSRNFPAEPLAAAWQAVVMPLPAGGWGLVSALAGLAAASGLARRRNRG